MNRPLAAIIALAVASPLIAVALNASGIGPGFEVHEPEWSPGHNWQYDMSMTARARGQVFGVAEGETPNVQVDMTRGFEVLNTEIDHAGIPLQAAFQTMQLERVLFGDRVLYDHDDPEAAESFDDEPEMGGADDMLDGDMLCLARCDLGMTLLTKQLNPFLSAEPFADDREGPEVVRLFDFPLTRDKTWTVISFAEDDILFEIQATAVEEEYINPDGMTPLSTIRIEAGFTDASRDSLTRALEAEAAGEDVNLNLDFDLSMTYWYAPKVENIVRFVSDAHVTGTGSGYGAAGMFRVDTKLVEDLKTYDLAVEPQRDIPGTERLAQAALATGTDAGLSDTPFDFELAADKRAVETTTGDTVQLALVAPGQGSESDAAPLTLPEGARVEWTHERPITEGPGTATSTHAGPGPALDITTPGVHTMTARVYDENGLLMGVDQLEIEGYTDLTIALETAGTPLDPAVTRAFTVAPRADTLTGAIESSGFTLGTLTIEGPNAYEQTGTVRSGDIVVPEPEPGAWTAEWEEAAHAGATEIRIVVRYVLDDGAAAADASGPGSMMPDLQGLLGPLAGLL